MVRAVERGMLRRTEDDIPHLGLDEKSSERGYTYVSILADIDRSRVLDLVPERKLEAAKKLLGTLNPTQRVSVKAIAMDMWPAFISAAKACLPEDLCRWAQRRGGGVSRLEPADPQDQPRWAH